MLAASLKPESRSGHTQEMEVARPPHSHQTKSQSNALIAASVQRGMLVENQWQIDLQVVCLSPWSWWFGCGCCPAGSCPAGSCPAGAGAGWLATLWPQQLSQRSPKPGIALSRQRNLWWSETVFSKQPHLELPPRSGHVWPKILPDEVHQVHQVAEDASASPIRQFSRWEMSSSPKFV